MTAVFRACAHPRGHPRFGGFRQGGAGVALLCALVLAGCSARETPVEPASTVSATPASDWRLVPADEISGPQHLVVTVALSHPSALAELSAALEADHPVELVAEWPLNALKVHCFVFRLKGAEEARAVRARLVADSRVRTVQQMQEFQTLGVSYRDELVGLQAGLTLTAALEAHRFATGAGVRVGVVDTLPDAAHPDLADRLSLARDFVGRGAALRAEDHGTAVAGVIAADAANGRGMVGMAPGAEILALRGCWETAPGEAGRCSSFSLARALNFALLNDVDILNLSLGGPEDPLLDELIRAAVSKGIVVVAAQGGSDRADFPASAAGTIAVAGWPLRPGNAAGMDKPTVFAPGRDILSTAPRGSYDFFSGSSIAAAHVSGIAALIREVRPDLGPSEIGAALVSRGARGDRPVDACRTLADLAPEGGFACGGS
ncbi:MAG: S8 family serine peptidase [Pikeienuella sp.]